MMGEFKSEVQQMDGPVFLPAGSSLFSRTMYDILGRATSQYTGYDLDESTYAEALTVTDDTILEQSSSSYNEVGSVLSVTAKQRYHDAPASQTGALGTPTTSPKARVTYSASWYDGTGRATAAADYGTNGGAAFTRPSTPPASSDTILVSVTSFNSDGEVQSVTDPAGMVTQLEYDAAGRRVTQIDNYVSGGTQADQNRTTWTTYTPDGQMATLTASNSSTGNQQTTYSYGTTLSNSAIASSQLLRWVQYPDSSGSGGYYVTYSYNRQGQQTQVTDQGGCQHAFDYDGLGRQIHDRVLTLGTTAIGNARRISTVYDSRGLVSTITTWDDSRVGYGSVLNQVQNVYNDFGQQTHSYQSHAGSVDLMNTPTVQYSYASGSANTIRMTGMTYPDGRGLSVDYGTAGDINDASSRVQSLKFTAEAFSLADYQYLGASGFVNQASSQPGISWTLYGAGTDPDTGDIYSGLDRFGRIDNCLWQKGTTTLAQLQYGYDRASNRTWRQDGVLSGYDELYQYDGLQRLKDQKRGTLNSTHTAITSSTFQQQWGLDATGNWSSFKQDDDGSGSWDLVQSRSANKVNEITSISNSTGTAWNTPLYDPAGNMIGIPNGGATVTGATPAWVPFTESQWTGFTEAQWNAFTEDTGTTPQQITAQYDAWNRLVKVITTPLNFVEHVYDGRGFRIGRRTTVSNTVTEDRHYYYTPGWQCLEERVGSVTTAERQFVWGLRYIDDLVIRDRSTANNGTINERRYAMQDGNWNSIAICDTTGSVGERYAYSAYGAPVFMTGAGTVQTSSPIGFETLYAGYRWDNPAPQMYYVRNRFLLGTVGTWNRRDPLGSYGNLYSNVTANSLNFTDPFGLQEEGPEIFGGVAVVPPEYTGPIQFIDIAIQQQGLRPAGSQEPCFPVAHWLVCPMYDIDKSEKKHFRYYQAQTRNFGPCYGIGTRVSYIIPRGGLPELEQRATELIRNENLAMGAAIEQLSPGKVALLTRKEGGVWKLAKEKMYREWTDPILLARCLGGTMLAHHSSFPPTYNLGGTGEIPGTINVQPPYPNGSVPPLPRIIAPSNALPIGPGAGNVICNSSPIFPQPGTPALGPPYCPKQIAQIARGGFNISITQGANPGTVTVGQQAVINAVPRGSSCQVFATDPYMTTVNIATPLTIPIWPWLSQPLLKSEF